MMLDRVKQLFSSWIDATAAAIQSILGHLVAQRRVVFTPGQGTSFIAQAPARRKGPALPEISLNIENGKLVLPLPEHWRAALRGSQIEVRLRTDQVLLRPVAFPKQASDFLGGMIRAQIDRLTPWTADEAVFGWSVPQPAAGERIALTLAATSRALVQPLIALAGALEAKSVAGVVEAATGETTEIIKIFEQGLHRGIARRTDVPRLLRHALLAIAVATVATLGVTGYLGSMIAADQQSVQRQIAQRRASLRLNQQGGGSAENLLARRKQTTPATVIALEAISRVLPDSTYVTELRIEGDKIQVAGMTQDAPSLIRLIEQSPQFTRATFFAPTTRAQNEPGERFHIEAHLTAYFGSGS